MTQDSTSCKRVTNKEDKRYTRNCAGGAPTRIRPLSSALWRSSGGDPPLSVSPSALTSQSHDSRFTRRYRNRDSCAGCGPGGWNAGKSAGWLRERDFYRSASYCTTQCTVQRLPCARSTPSNLGHIVMHLALRDSREYRIQGSGRTGPHGRPRRPQPQRDPERSAERMVPEPDVRRVKRVTRL